MDRRTPNIPIGLPMMFGLCTWGEETAVADRTHAGPDGRWQDREQGGNAYAWDDGTLVILHCRPAGTPDSPYLLRAISSLCGGEHGQVATSTIGLGPAVAYSAAYRCYGSPAIPSFP